MNTKRFFFLAMVALIAGAVSTQTQTQNDARALLQAVAKNQGTGSLKALQYTASGMIAAPGQSYTSMDMGVGVPEHWPRFGVTDYTMTVDFEMMSSKADLYSPPAPGAQPPAETPEGVLALGMVIRTNRLTVVQHVPIHGRPGTQEEFAKILGNKVVPDSHGPLILPTTTSSGQ